MRRNISSRKMLIILLVLVPSFWLTAMARGDTVPAEREARIDNRAGSSQRFRDHVEIGFTGRAPQSVCLLHLVW